ncbi:MAG: endolytic transglycosylase MltG [Maritimibacter sp.]
MVLLIAFGGLIAWGQKQYSAPGPLASAICLKVPSGSSFRTISKTLSAQGAVSSDSVLRIGANYSGKAQDLKAGSFLVPEGASMAEIVDIVTRGGASTCGSEIVYRIGILGAEYQVRELDPGTERFVTRAEFTPEAEQIPASYLRMRDSADTRYRIAVAEGATVWQIANALSQADFLDGDAGELPPEGMLAPDSYEVRAGDKVADVLEQMRATAYVAHPYQFPIIGWPSDIASWTQEDLENFYETYYAPNNITMVVVGDVTPDEVFELAEDYLEDIPAQDPPAAVRTVEPEQLGERRVVVETDARTPMLHVAFHAGAAADPETLAMRLLLSILVYGDSARLHRLFVEEEQLAISIGAFPFEGFDPGLVYFYATLPPGGDLVLLEQRLFEELMRIAEEGVSDAELEKARNIALAEFWGVMATINGKAASLGEAAVFHGSYEKLFDFAQDIEAVSGETLKMIAGRVFRRDNATIGMLYAPAVEAEVEE